MKMTTDNEKDNPADTEEYRDWPHDLSSLQKVGEEALERWRNEHPQSPRDYPAVRWLDENGYAHLRRILRDKHEMGVPEFFILLTSAGGSQEFEWGIDDVATIERARAYLEDQSECRDWESSTKRTNRSRLNEVLRRFAEEYGDDSVLALANNSAIEPEVYRAFKEVCKSLRAELSSHDSAHSYLRAAHRYFEWLDRAGRIDYDPMDGIEDEFRWDWSAEATPLSGQQVRRLWIAADTHEERMLVIGYCVWGVRTKELPGIHVSQLDFNSNDPSIEFGERSRKNGQGTVTLMFGLGDLANLLDDRDCQPDWNGYFYPSSNQGREFLCAKQMRKRFKKLCRKAGVTIKGEPATPKHGRSFYYNILADAETELLEMAGEIAKVQGASDPKSVREYYLTSERRRWYRRVFFRHRIRQVLPEDAYTAHNTNRSFDGSVEDFS